MHSVNPKRSRRISDRAAQSQQARPGRRCENGNSTSGQDKKKSFEANKRREVNENDTGTVQDLSRLSAEVVGDQEEHPHRSQDSLVVRSVRSEPSTVTLNTTTFLRDAHAATMEDITTNNPSVMPVSVGPVEESLPQEGVGSIEGDEFSQQPEPSRPDFSERTSGLEALKKVESPVKPFLDRSRIGIGNLNPSSAEENPRRTLSISDGSPRSEGVSALESKVSSLEKEMQSMHRNLNEKLEKVLEGLEKGKGGVAESELKDIVHSL